MVVSGHSFLLSAFKLVPLAASTTVILIAISGLIGWAWQGDVSSQGWFPMSAVTASCLLLSGLSLWLQRTLEPTSSAQRWAQAIAALVGLVTIFILAKFLFDWQPEMEGGAASTTQVSAMHWGNMTPHTAVIFLLYSGALLWLNIETSNRRRPAQYLAFAGGIISWMALLGYSYGASTVSIFAPYPPMGLHTALAFIVLSLGILSARPEQGLMTLVTNASAGGLLIRRLVLSAVLLPTTLGWVYTMGQKAGYYDANVGVSLLVAGNIIVFLIVVWRSAETLHLVDNERQKEETALRQSRNGLEVQVRERTQELRQSELLKHTVLDALPQQLAVLDQAGTIIEVNRAWQRFALEHKGTGLGDQIGVGANYLAACRNVATPDFLEAQQMVKGIEAVLTGEKQIFTLEYSRHLTPGQRWFRLTAVPLPDENYGAVVSHTDVTERRRLYEAELKARLRAEEASRRKDEFLAVVSHELRSPLNAILGWVNLLRGGKLTAEAAARALATIENSARIQNRLVSDLIDVSRIITGKLRLNVSLVKPARFIEAAIETVRLAAEARGIQLQTEIDEDIGFISGDADRLQQIVWNLVSNAIRFTPRGGRIQVRMERANSAMKIIVRDNGRGIKPEFLPFVFDRFSQEDSTSTRKMGGLGMGLAIVRHLVELHGGEVQVESAGEGQGATFTVKLPLTLDRAGQQNPPHLRPMAEEKLLLDCPPALHDLRVLVVDDDPETLDLVNLTLTKCGAEVKTAASVNEALAWLANPAGWRPEVLISTLEMLRDDGSSLIRRVRAQEAPNAPKLSAIALTASARAEDRMRALSAGFQMHVPKPVEPAELLTVVASVAGRLEQRNHEEVKVRR